jgi:hypothetical protein
MSAPLGTDKYDIESNGHTIIFSMNRKEILSGFSNPPPLFGGHSRGDNINPIG